MTISEKIEGLRARLASRAELVAVSKTFPVESIEQAYAVGQRKFGESRPQELKAKSEQLPSDVEWHMIGHLQSNKVRMILPVVHLIESLNSRRLAQVIEREAERIERTVDCLLEIQLSDEESKSGWDWSDLSEFVEGGGFEALSHIRLRGVMGIATYTDDMSIVERDFRTLRTHFDYLKSRFGESFDTVSMGMSSDYELALECGSTSVRIGSYIFGGR